MIEVPDKVDWAGAVQLATRCGLTLTRVWPIWGDGGWAARVVASVQRLEDGIVPMWGEGYAATPEVALLKAILQALQRRQSPSRTRHGAWAADPLLGLTGLVDRLP